MSEKKTVPDDLHLTISLVCQMMGIDVLAINMYVALGILTQLAETNSFWKSWEHPCPKSAKLKNNFAVHYVRHPGYRPNC